MTTYYGANRTQTISSQPTKIPKGESGGKLKVYYDSYTLPGAVLQVDDVIDFMKLPAGLRVIEAILESPSLGTTGKLKLGFAANGVDSEDTTAFIAEHDAGGSAAITKMSSTANGAGLYKKFTAATKVIGTCTEITTETATKIECLIFGVLD